MDRLRAFAIRVRYMQFIFLAIMFYGVAMLSYDLVRLIPGMPISNWSIGCSVFGAEGVIATFLLVRSMDKKIEKLLREAREFDGGKTSG